MTLGLKLKPRANTGLYELDLLEALIDGGEGPLVDPAAVLGTEAVDDCRKKNQESVRKTGGALQNVSRHFCR